MFQYRTPRSSHFPGRNGRQKQLIWYRRAFIVFREGCPSHSHSSTLGVWRKPAWKMSTLYICTHPEGDGVLKHFKGPSAQEAFPGHPSDSVFNQVAYSLFVASSPGKLAWGEAPSEHGGFSVSYSLVSFAW